MALPKGVSEATYNTIDNLKKASYGLKTATRLWNKTINAFLSLEFKQSEADPDLYIHDKGNANMKREKGDTT